MSISKQREVLSKKIGETDLCHNTSCLPVGDLMLIKFFLILVKQKRSVYLLDLGLLPAWSAETLHALPTW